MNEANPVRAEQSGEIDYMELDKIIEEDFKNEKENLIMILQAIQRKYNYLPEEALSYLSASIGLPISHIFGVATFYKTFSLEPRGKNLVSICLGTACHVRGGERVRERIEEKLNIRDGETTEDQRFTLETVRCVGCCSLGPVVKVNEDTHARVSSDEIKKILEGYE